MVRTIKTERRNKITIYQNEKKRGMAQCSQGFTKKYVIKSGDTTTLSKAVEFDNCPALYKDGHKIGENFLMADCILADIDNTHSDVEADWITHEDVKKALPNVAFYYYPSRNHMKTKNGRSARPKEHYIFPTATLNTVEEYTDTMKRLIEAFPNLHFDKAVKGGAQLNFGVENPKVEYVDGAKNLTEFLENFVSAYKTRTTSKSVTSETIPQGERNTTLFKFACQTLKRLGNTEEARKFYSEECKKCSPPLGVCEISDIWNNALKYHEKDMKTASNNMSSNQSKIVISQAYTYRPNNFTDVGQAEIFSRIYGKKIKFSLATNYLYYTGKVWEENRLKVQLIAQQLTTSQLQEACTDLREAQDMETEAVVSKDKEATKNAKTAIRYAKKYREYALSRQHTNRIEATLKEAHPMLEVDIRLLDRDGLLLNTPDGTVNLNTKELQQHNYEDYCTKITEKSPSDDGMDIFMKFLEVITCVNKELEEYLQYVAGMIAIGKVFSEHLIIAYGCGKNGKSTFFNLLSRVLGNYSGSLSSETLTANCRKNKSLEYAELRGKRLVIAAELEDGMRLDTAIVKKLCSTDPVHAEKKYKAPFSFIPSHTVVLYTNHLPDVAVLDSGTWRRLVVIPFNAVIDSQSEIKNYTDYLYENAGGAVMKWLVEGAYKYIKAGHKLPQPDIVTQAIEQYRRENDWINNYISERCIVDRTFKQPSGKLYEDYRNYCKSIGESAKSNASFNRALEEKGFHRHKESSGSYIYGLRLASELIDFSKIRIPIATMTVDDGEIQDFCETEIDF